MANRKFTKNGETPTKFQCAKRKCKWEGKENEKGRKQDGDWTIYVCPRCGNEEFYGLLYH